MIRGVYGTHGWKGGPTGGVIDIPTLFLANDLTGNSELCSLFLHADHRSGLNGRLLSKARFLFIAEFRHLFGNKVIEVATFRSNPSGQNNHAQVEDGLVVRDNEYGSAEEDALPSDTVK